MRISRSNSQTATLNEMIKDDCLWLGFIPVAGWICSAPMCVCCCWVSTCECLANCCNCCMNPAEKNKRAVNRSYNLYRIARYEYRTCNYCCPLGIGRCCANCLCGDKVQISYVNAIRSGAVISGSPTNQVMS